MTRLSATIDLDVPASLCIEAVQATMTDDRLAEALRGIRPGKEYSGYVKMVIPGRRLTIDFPGLEPLRNKRYHSLGWRVTYDFSPAQNGRTRVEISVEYGKLAAIMGGGLVNAQAQNELAHRLFALRMLEFASLNREEVSTP